MIGTGSILLPVSLSSIDYNLIQPSANAPLVLADYSVSFYLNEYPNDFMAYTYTPVPEPSSILGLIACACGIATWASSRKR